MKIFTFPQKQAPAQSMRQVSPYQGIPVPVRKLTEMEISFRAQRRPMLFLPLRADAYREGNVVHWQYGSPPPWGISNGATMPNASPLLLQGLHYREADSGLVQKLKSGDEKAISNVRIRVKKRVICYCMDGSIKEDYVCEVFCAKWPESREFKIAADETRNLFFLLKKEWPQVTLYQNTHDAVEEYLSEVFSTGQDRWETVVERELRGWAEDQGRVFYAEGKHFLYATAPVPAVQNYPIERQQEIVQKGLEFMQVGHDGPEIATIFLYSHLGFTAFWLERGGIPLHFCLYLSGKTGVLKTSVASTLANVFETCPEKKNLRFTGTPASIKNVLATMNDGTAFVDDFSNSEKEGRKKGKANMEMLIRMVGDGVVESKMIGENVSQRKARFGLILAGETEPDLSQSSVLRYLLVRIHEDTFDATRLDYYQRQEPMVLREYFSLYILFLQTHGAELCAWIHEHLPDMREKYAYLPTRRTRDMAVIFEIESCCLAWFASEMGMPKQFVAELTSTFSQVSSLLEQHEADSRKLSVTEMFLTGIFQSLQTQRVALAVTEDEYWKNGNEKGCIGFFEKQKYLWLDFPQAYQTAISYWEMLGKDFLATEQQIKEQLADENLIVVHKKKNGGRDFVIKTKKGARTRMLVCRLAELKKQGWMEKGEE